MELITSDADPAYETAIREADGEEVLTTATGRESRKMVAEKVLPPGLNYATVEKRREKGRVVEVLTRVVLGTMAAITAVLARSKASRSINTAFVERQNGTDRTGPTMLARSVRRTRSRRIGVFMSR